MNPKSFITLCIVGILYVIIGATAVLSPHDTGLAKSQLANGNNHSSPVTPLTGKTDRFIIGGDTVDNERIEIPITLESMTAFTSSRVTVNIDNENVTFTAVDFGETLYKWTGFKNSDANVVVTDTAGNKYNFRLVDMKQYDNAYICYADSELEPLDHTKYGSFCLVVISGDNAGIITGLSYIDLNAG